MEYFPVLEKREGLFKGRVLVAMGIAAFILIGFAAIVLGQPVEPTSAEEAGRILVEGLAGKYGQGIGMAAAFIWIAVWILKSSIAKGFFRKISFPYRVLVVAILSAVAAILTNVVLGFSWMESALALLGGPLASYADHVWDAALEATGKKQPKTRED